MFPAIAVTVSAVFLFQALDLGFGTLRTPGAGLWPFAISIVTIVLAVVQAALPEASGGKEESAPGSLRRPLVHALALGGMILVYAFLVDLVGYLLLTTALVFAAAMYVAHARWWSAALSALVSTGLVFMVFSGLLGIPLPIWPAL